MTRDEKIIHTAFRDFVYQETNWRIMYKGDNYYGATAERYKAFEAGYMAAIKMMQI